MTERRSPVCPGCLLPLSDASHGFSRYGNALRAYCDVQRIAVEGRPAGMQESPLTDQALLWSIAGALFR